MLSVVQFSWIPTLATKKIVFEACMMFILLYASECWVPLQTDILKLSLLYMQCIRTILGVSRHDMWDLHISNSALLQRWNAQRPLPIRDCVLLRQLEWFGHVVRMDVDRSPRLILFGCLQKLRPACGPRKHLWDVVQTDLLRCGVQDSWPEVARSRPEWRAGHQALQLFATASTKRSVSSMQETLPYAD